MIELCIPKNQTKKKSKKHTIVGNTKFYYNAKSQLKRLKIEKPEFERDHFLMTTDPGVYIVERKLMLVTPETQRALNTQNGIVRGTNPHYSPPPPPHPQKGSRTTHLVKANNVPE